MRRDKLVARYLEHGIQDLFIADAAIPQLNFDHPSAFFFKWQWLAHLAKHLAGGRPGHRAREGYLAAAHSGCLNHRSTACARPEFFSGEKISNPARSWVLVSFPRPSHSRESGNPPLEPLEMCCRTGFPLSRE